MRHTPATVVSAKKQKLNLSYTGYRDACNEAYRVNMSNPTVYWNHSDGFYIAPSKSLVANDDLTVGLAYYCLNNGSKPSLSGTRREYQPIARAIRKYHGLDFQKFETYSLPENMKCNENSDEPCGEFLFITSADDKAGFVTCEKCGRKTKIITICREITLEELVENEQQNNNEN